MSVTSTPLVSAATPAKIRRHPQWAMLPTSLVGVIIGLIIWAIGARYTMDGLVNGANVLLEFFSVPHQIKPVWTLYAWLIPLPVAFSLIEQFMPPIQRFEGKRQFVNLWVGFVWLVIAGVDLASTGYGLLTSSAGPGFLHQLATTIPGLVFVCVFLTFVPERLLRAMIGFFWRALSSVWHYTFAG